jgi:hypothetical protein
MCFWNAIFVYILLSMFVMAPSRDKSIMRGQLIRFKRVRRSKVIFSNRNRSTRFSVCTQSNPTGCSPLTTWYGRESRPPLPSCRQNWEKTWQITVHPVPSIQQNQPKVPKGFDLRDQVVQFRSENARLLQELMDSLKQYQILVRLSTTGVARSTNFFVRR